MSGVDDAVEVSPISVLILDTSTGEQRAFSPDFGWYGDFIWSDGNFACDCARGDFFAEAGGEPEGEADAPCGDTRYLVKITGPDGAVLYDELEA